MKKDVREIDIDRISPDLRSICSAETIDDLAWDIRLRSQLDPIRIRFARDRFRIVDGEKRWRACKKLGMSLVKAIIEEVEPLPA